MADEDSREIRARREQAQQDAAGRGMLFKQREERGPCADRSDELGEVHQRQVGIGQPAYFVDHHRAESFEQLATPRAGRRMRGSAREQFEMPRAFVRAREVQLAQIAGRGVGIERRIPREFRRGRDPTR